MLFVVDIGQGFYRLQDSKRVNTSTGVPSSTVGFFRNGCDVAGKDVSRCTKG